ncbi:MAG TPA: response regulator transcription factor [Dehalococcoidia bacterium]|jgi:DNA-binding NarL/FixJ family response regulator|nr:response regulator transcription factor [Dehalococcoidia bacterium]
MSEQKIKVFTFCQQPLLGEGIRHWLSSMEDMEVIGQAEVTGWAVAIEVMPPDVVIVDMDVPSDSGMSLIRRLTQVLPSVGVIALASNLSEDQFVRVLATQVAAYLNKEVSGDYLADIVRRVARGEYPIYEALSSQPEIADGVLRQFRQLSGKREDETTKAQLTVREIEIVNHIAQGRSNKQIASELNISEQTIKNHVSSIMTKLSANDRTEAVVLALKTGLISLA